ncbi:MAG TPA: polyprenol monophosphomannose synthase [Candidatus Manganitrophaceae bacterium]|nr:polyprenol monophosphomannose synthase [Candidatus Manganitrophaceae bacterium]
MSHPYDRILIIIPTYNESENISTLIDEIYHTVRREVDVLVIDDNSPDGTGKVVSELSRRNPRVALMERKGKEGYARAYLEGFSYALKNHYSVIVCMDADLSHHPTYLNQFFDLIQENDFVLGSRYIPGGGVENWGWFRRFLSRGGNLYARWVLNASICDLTSGYKCFRSQMLAKIGYQEIKSKGYEFNMELTYLFHRNGFSIKEVPIIFTDRRYGSSKLSKWMILEALIKVWKLRLGSKRKR